MHTSRALDKEKSESPTEYYHKINHLTAELNEPGHLLGLCCV